LKPEFLELRNPVKHYEWGSNRWIPQLLGKENPEGRPWAEMWMGSHPGSPSKLSFDEAEISLGDLIATDPPYYLGKQAAAQYGVLPFLLKLLAAEKPLSIQAHPSLPRAQEGFQRENIAGPALEDPRRNYKDPNHKPEIICALTPFTGMCGFREPCETQQLLDGFLEISKEPASSKLSPALPETMLSGLRKRMSPLLRALQEADSAIALKNFLDALFSLSAEAREGLSRYIMAFASGASDRYGVSAGQWELMFRFAELYPDDPAVISPLYLNIFHLEPGEAVFLNPGTLHAYIHGFGVELMANSDNVLRGGLTPKHIDLDELQKVLDFKPRMPEILKPQNTPAPYAYPTPCREFSLSVICGAGEEISFYKNGPVICIVTSGELEIQGKKTRALIPKGGSVFIPAVYGAGAKGAGAKGADGALRFRGKYTLYAASLPEP
jgi:mannose-6-phosphate isomerase